MAWHGMLSLAAYN